MRDCLTVADVTALEALPEEVRALVQRVAAAREAAIVEAFERGYELAEDCGKLPSEAGIRGLCADLLERPL